MDIDKKLLGNRIKSIRLSLGDNMREFGERLGSELRQASNLSNESNPSDSIVSRWEKGVSVPSPDRLKAIADLGGITVNELLYGPQSISELLNENLGSNFSGLKKLVSDDFKNSEAFSELQKTLSDLSTPAPNEEERSFINNKTTLIEELDKQHAQIESELDEFLTLIKTETDEEERYVLSSQISQNYEILEHLEEAKLKLISNPEFKFYVHNKVIYLIVNKDELTIDDVKFNVSQYDNLIVRKNGEEIVHLTDIDNNVLIDTIKKYHDWNTSIILTVNAWFKMLDLTQHV